jgi:predicted nucleic acid-binding protein
VNVVDSSGWIAFFRAEPNADAFANPVGDLDDLLVPSICLTEVFKYLVRYQDEVTAVNATSHMCQGWVIALDGALALDAADCALKFGLPLADSIIYATARKFAATLWTQDADFKDLPGVKFFP